MQDKTGSHSTVFFLFIPATFAKKAGYWVIWRVAGRIRKSLWALKAHLASGAPYLISLIIGKIGCCTEHVVFALFLFLTFIIKSAALHLHLPGKYLPVIRGKAASDWRLFHLTAFIFFYQILVSYHSCCRVTL